MEKIKTEEFEALNRDNQTLLKNRSKAFAEKKEVLVPIARAPPTRGAVATPTRPLLFVTFADSAAETELHVAPDPLLLLAKAAVVWGKLTSGTILATGLLADDDDTDSLDELAFYESITPSIPKEISVVTPGFI